MDGANTELMFLRMLQGLLCSQHKFDWFGKDTSIETYCRILFVVDNSKNFLFAASSSSLTDEHNESLEWKDVLADELTEAGL